MSPDEEKAFEARIAGWSCPAPAGGEHIRPLYGLTRADDRLIREARERVELERRTTYSGSWDSAVFSFQNAQVYFSGFYEAPAYHQMTIQRSFPERHPDTPLHEWRSKSYLERYEMYKRRYDALCETRKQLIMEMMADEGALAALRKEVAQPWLREENRLPCAIADVAGCERTDGSLRGSWWRFWQ